MYAFFLYIEYKFSLFYKTKATGLKRSVAICFSNVDYCI